MALQQWKEAALLHGFLFFFLEDNPPLHVTSTSLAIFFGLKFSTFYTLHVFSTSQFLIFGQWQLHKNPGC